MSRCILHIGMHKTGTSSIQQSLHGFADDAFVYADISDHSNHARTIFELIGFDAKSRKAAHGERRQRRASRLAPSRDVERRVEDSIKRSGTRTYVISGEGLLVLPTRHLEDLRDYLQARFDDVAVYAAIRAPASYMASAFQERLKTANRLSALDLLRYRDYRRTFVKFDEVFGKENVTMWKFDPGTFPEGCVVQDFCQRLGIAFPKERIVRANESLSREAVSLLYTYRKYGQRFGSLSISPRENRALVRKLTLIGKTRFRFAPELTSPVLNTNREDIAWMEQRLGSQLRDDDAASARPDDIRCEEDLVASNGDALAELNALPGAAEGSLGSDPESIARAIHRLARQAPAAGRRRRR